MGEFTGLSSHRRLGQSGLWVSPLSLGAMTFGQGDGWRADEESSREMFCRYVEAGGNFLDTANTYANGRSEELLGQFARETQTRDQLVIATKYSQPNRAGDPNAAGNGRKNALATLDQALTRLQTDYIDLFYLHVWDTQTPAEEVLSTLDAAVRSGKVRAIGLSNVPAWYMAKVQTLAKALHWEPIAALQMEYSLIERSIEDEFLPAAADLGIAVIPWSPLGFGFLTGKYERTSGGLEGDGRVVQFQSTPAGRSHTDQQWATLEVVQRIARELGRSTAQIALNWVANRPGVVSTTIGARTVHQLEENLATLDFELPREALEELEQVSRPHARYPYTSFARGQRA